jgi:hypothetical protein
MIRQFAEGKFRVSSRMDALGGYAKARADFSLEFKDPFIAEESKPLFSTK